MRNLFEGIRNLFRRSPAAGVPAANPGTWPLDQEMVRLTPHDCLTARDLFEGVLALGSPGSGKTSTSATIILRAALHAGWSVVAFGAKPDDAPWFEHICRRAGRSHHLRVIRPDGLTHFNLCRYELSRPGGGNSLTLADLLTEVAREGRPPALPTEGSEFFESSSKMLLCHCLDAFQLAGQPVSLDAIRQFLVSAPEDSDTINDDSWEDSYCRQILVRAAGRAPASGQNDLADKVGRFFLQTWSRYDSRTRGNILATLESALFELSRDPVRTLIDSPHGCSFVPEMIEQGAVYFVDCPSSVHGTVGRRLTIAFKRIFKDMLRRRTPDGDRARPVLVYSDEAQLYVTRDDADFQQTCRSGRVAVFMATQSIDNFNAVLGSEAHTNSLANALTTNLVHCCVGRTAEWVQERIAQQWREMQSFSVPGAGDPSPHRTGLNISEGLYPQVLASELARLKTGGSHNDRVVSLIAFKPGRVFRASGRPFVRVHFRQSEEGV